MPYQLLLNNVSPAAGARKCSNVSVSLGNVKLHEIASLTTVPNSHQYLCFFSSADHYAGALPHYMPINLLSDTECQSNGFSPIGSTCGKPQYDACDVDMGSALVCTRGDGKYLMKGLYSSETTCGASPNQLITFTKMDVPWLKSRGRNTNGSPVNARLQRHPESQTNNYLPPQY